MKEKKTVSRRSFIQKSVGAAALLTIPTIIPANVFGANDKVMVFERDIVWITFPGRRKTEKWLHDQWLMEQKQ